MCSKTLAKIWLVVFNFIFFLLGAACLGLGIFVLVDKSRLQALLKVVDGGGLTTETLDVPSLLESGAYALIAGGAAVFLIGFLGCCGALKEVKCFLYTYAIIVSLILICEITAGVLAYIYRDTVAAYLKTYLNATIVEKYEGMRYSSDGKVIVESAEPFSLAWDFANVVFDCCGLENYTDFYNYATKWNKTYEFEYNGNTLSVQAQVPVSCCLMVDKSKFPGALSELQFVDAFGCMTAPSATTTHLRGCYSAVESLIMQYSTIVLGVGIGIACVELLSIIMAAILIWQLKKDEKGYA